MVGSIRAVILTFNVLWGAALVAAPPESDLAPLVRFYNHLTNEHCYSHLPRELGEWRTIANVKEHYTLGRVATKKLPGTVPLFRIVRKTDGRHYYTLTPMQPSSLYEIDRVNFRIYVWTNPGDGRVPVYVSTWVDNSDVYLERELSHVEKFSADSKRALNVNRLRPTEGPLFYIYPEKDTNPSNDQPTPTPPAAEIAKSDLVKFEPVALNHPASSMTISEDGKLLFIGHQQANAISVYDVLKHQVITQIDCPAPRSILSRGSHLIVGNFGQGTVTVFDGDQSWTATQKIRLPKLKIIHLSSALGTSFTGQVLVTCHGDGYNADSQDCHQYWIDINGDRKTEVGKSPLAFVSADGRCAMVRDHLGIKVIDWNTYTGAGEKAQDLYRGEGDQDTFIYQVAMGSYWFGINYLLSGVPMQRLPGNFSQLVVADHSQPVIYVLDDLQLRAHRLATTLPELSERDVAWPPDFPDRSQILNHLQQVRAYTFQPPIAWTHGESLYLFVLTAQRNQLLRAKTDAFKPRNSGSYNSPAALALASLTSNKSQRSRKAKPEPAAKSTDATANNSSGLTKGMPATIAAGKELKHQLPAPSNAKFELLSAIPGVRLSPTGELRWNPSPDQLGKHELKIRITSASEIVVQRVPIEVADPELLASLNGDLSKFETAQKLMLEAADCFLCNAQTPPRTMLLQGEHLLLLASNGFEVQRKLQLPKRYKLVQDRKDYLVAVVQDECVLDLIDKRSLKVKRSIVLERPEGKVDSVSDMTLDPAHPLTYITVRHDTLVPHNSVLKIDENTGQVTPMSIFGTWVAVSPDGQRVFTGHRDVFQRGSQFHINPNWNVIEIPRYGSIDILMSWDPKDEGTILQATVAPGSNGHGLRLSPDGRRIIYLSYTGDAGFPGDLIGWNTLDYDKDPVRYPTKDVGSTTELAFHPWLPILAVPGKGTAIFFDQDTGKERKNMLIMPAGGLGDAKIERLHFAADGKHLLFACSDDEGRYVRSVNLRLSAAELEQKKRQPAQFDPAILKRTVPNKQFNLSELTALAPEANAKFLTPKEIGRKYLDAVVTIKTDQGNGSGFFISPTGYLLTSAHVVVDAKKISVIHNKAAAGKPFEPFESPAELVTIDVRLDAALLKIAPSKRVEVVRFAAEETVEAGEPVIVIGNPGMGREILTRTMTNGIVSNPDRELAGIHYVQTSAAINPGNSGGAMFDSRGHVIGMVNLKARIEGAAFALPTATLRQFLKDAATP